MFHVEQGLVKELGDVVVVERVDNGASVAFAGDQAQVAQQAQLVGAGGGFHVRVGAAVAALGSLLALILGVSRTTLAMARDHHLPHALAAVHPKFKVPHRAELVVGAVVAIAAATTDVRGAIGFSSFGVLAYYAIANASAWTLTPAEDHPARIIPVAGLAGCLVLAFALPVSCVVSGAAVLLVGAAAYATRRVTAHRQ